MVISGIIISFCYEWRLALLMLAAVPPTCIIMSFMAKKTTASMMQEMRCIGKAGEIAEESIMGIRTVQAFNAQEHMTQK
ncbi:hypothetical protein WR25_06859 [Diploscapter pachys]|uniref:ABC transmembrane type-1 domain-containing protein n=1 Tax=Diploscapter pachys TaxID=2018661 RepID=A0A2A2JR66_9BILA|nr:hypothetical protein WR25_06859 [Diploscapter pachys]